MLRDDSERARVVRFLGEQECTTAEIARHMHWTRADMPSTRLCGLAARGIIERADRMSNPAGKFRWVNLWRVVKSQ